MTMSTTKNTTSMRGQDTPGEAWPELTRSTKTIVVVDLVESVRLMQLDEAGVIDRWRRFVHEVRSQVLPSLDGRMVKSLGDGMLLEFDSVPVGTAAALEIQRRLLAGQPRGPRDVPLQLRIGMHHCEVVHDELDVYGSGVNLAARLTTLALPGDIVVSSEVREQLLDGIDAGIEDLGECWLKSLSEPIRAWRLRPAAQPAGQGSSLSLDRTELRASVAVLPLRTLAGEQPQLMLGEFVAEELTTCLSRVPYLAVISSLSTATLRQRVMPVADIARSLGTRYLVQGSCALLDAQLRIHVQLVDGHSQAIVWAGSATGSMAELLQGQSAAIAELSSQLAQALVGAEAVLADTRPLPALESYTLLFGAIAKLHRLSPDAFADARRMLEHLAERHPRSPIPKAWLGKWHVMRIGQGWSPDPADDGRQAAWQTGNALDLHPEHPLSLTLDGFVAGYVRKDFATAEQRYDMALQSNPNESLAWLFKSAMLGYRESTAEAISCADKAMSLSPLDPMRYYYEHFAALARLLAGEYGEAIRLGQKSLQGNRTHASTLRVLVMAQALDGQIDAARACAAQLRAIEPQLTVSSFRARYPGQQQGQVDRLTYALALAGIPP